MFAVDIERRGVILKDPASEDGDSESNQSVKA